MGLLYERAAVEFWAGVGTQVGNAEQTPARLERRTAVPLSQ